ncbi:MAG: MFS transporter [Anaerolineaceae bacterium]|nr:MFS transporter [Anaerolineaceae bacterium]
METTPQENLSIRRNLKLGLFHLGSSMADIIITGLWNRVMISDLGYAATPVSLLISLRYFLAPLGIWAGRISDQRSVGGFRRMFWIGTGRAMMAIGILILGVATTSLAQGGGITGMAGNDTAQWIGIVLAILLFSLGNSISGGTFLALLYDRTPEHQRGRAIGIVWTFLLIGYAIFGVIFGRLLPHNEGVAGLSFAPEALQNVFIIAAVSMAILWLISMIYEERRANKGGETYTSGSQQEYSTSALADLKLVINNRAMRYFMLFLALSMFSAFSQDLILEPFGGDVFQMDAAHTTRFNSYWGTTAIIGMILFLFLARRYKSLNNRVLSYAGVAILTAAFGIFTISALAQIRPLVTWGLLVFGIGQGIWTVGANGLMMDMSPNGRAGTFLGFWTLVVTFARGGGQGAGGIIHDIGISVFGSPSAAYGICFLVGTVGLALSIVMLRQANIKAYKAEHVPTDAVGVLATALD